MDVMSVYIVKADRMNQFIRVTSRHSRALAVCLVATVAVKGNPSKRHPIITIRIKVGEDHTTTLCCQT